MLLTLTAISLRAMLSRGKSGKAKLDLLDLPSFTRQDLGLHGLNMSTELLTGLSRETLEKLRERSDKAGCACLLLIESETQPLGDASESIAAGCIDRLQRVIQAAHILGCNAIAVRIAAPDDTATFQRTADRLRKAVQKAERLELNVLIAPTDGLTSTPERVTELIKKVGGFRVGTFPDFQAAAAVPDPVGYLRRLTPYAAVVSASTLKFVADKAAEKPASKSKPDDSSPGEAEDHTAWKHQPYDLEPLVSAILSVGYDGTLAIDYRGTGDAKLGVMRSRQALERLLEGEPAPADEDEDE